MSGSHFTTTASKSELLTCAPSVGDLFTVLLEGSGVSPFSHMTMRAWRSFCVCCVRPQGTAAPQLRVSAHAAAPDPRDKCQQESISSFQGKDLACDTTDPNRSVGFRYSVLQEKEEHQDSEFPLADLLQLCRGVFCFWKSCSMPYNLCRM